MAKKTTGRPVGRPVGTRTATVELETLSFKVPAVFKKQLQAYAKQRRESISALIREGIEWRIGEGDPLNLRYGTAASDEITYEGNTGNTVKVEIGVELLHGMLSVLVEDVRQLRGTVQALEQRLGETGSMQPPSVTGNTITVSVDGDLSEASMKAQMGEPGGEYASSVTGNTVGTTLPGDTWEDIPPYDTATRVLGKLCKRGHGWGNTGQSLLSTRNHGCLQCEADRKREREKAKREAQPVSG